MAGKIFAVSGIDTDIGKSVATGLLAKSIMRRMQEESAVITQKMVQTGCSGISEDILLHREIMDIELTPEDIKKITCSYVFTTPASPHLAARLDGEVIDIKQITATSKVLAEKYGVVLLEGAGGLQVPITIDYTFLDYIEEQKLPLIFVTSPRLGSINHTLNAFEITASRGIKIAAVFYNLFGFYEKENPIIADSRKAIQYYIEKYKHKAQIFDFADWRKEDKQEEYAGLYKAVLA